MKKKFSIIGTIIYLTCLLFPMFQPILTAVAEDQQPQLFTVSHNGKEIKADQEVEASDNNIIQIEATGNFTLKIPQSEGYEIGLLSAEEQQELKSQTKESDKLSFDVTSGEDGYQLRLEKGMKAYFKINLFAEAALLEGTASFEDVNLPETKMSVIHLVQPVLPETEASESQKEQPPADTEEKQEEVQEDPQEPSVEIKEVVFYKDGEKLDEATTLTAEEGKKFNPVENVTAKSSDGTEEYQVKAEVEENGKKLKLQDETFVPETKKNYLIQYHAVEEGQAEAISTLGVGLRASNGNVDVSLEWVTADTSQKYNQDFTVSQAGNQNVTYKLNINVGAKVYQPGQLKITLPASQFKFSNNKNLENALGWHKNNISINPLNDSNDDWFGYEVGEDGETLIITNKKTLPSASQTSLEISTIFYTEGRKYDGRPYPPLRGRQIVGGTNAKLKFEVEDATQTEPAKKNFSTNELKLTLKTQYKQPSISKSKHSFDPYDDWNAKLYGNRPSDFEQYHWVGYRIANTLSTENTKNLKTVFKDSIEVKKNGTTTFNKLTSAQLSNLKIYGYAEGAENFYTLADGGLSNRSISNNAINWTSIHDRDGSKFSSSTANTASFFYFVIGFPKTQYAVNDSVRNTIEASYYDKDTGGYYDKNTSNWVSGIEKYEFTYPPGDTTLSWKLFKRHASSPTPSKPQYYADPLKAHLSERIDEGLVTNVLQSGNDVDIRTASSFFAVNHTNGNSVPYSMEMYDDHTKWKTADSGEVFMGPDDFYFTRVYLQSETLLPVPSKGTNQKHGVVLPNLRLEYQDDTSGIWKTHEDLTIEPEVYKDRGTNPDGSTFDEYYWGRLRYDGQMLDRYFNLGQLGIRAHRFRLVTVDKNGNKAGVLGKVQVSVNADMCIYGVDSTDGKKTQLEKWIEEKKNVSELSFNNFSGFKVEARFSASTWILLNEDENDGNPRFDSDPAEYGNYLERKAGGLTIFGTGPTSNILKTARQENNTTTKANDVTWTVQWGEGYEAADTSGSILESMFNSGALTVPIRPKVILYDLLPVGHTYNGIQSVKYRGETLTDEQYTVETLSTNYNNTQRQLIALTIDGDSVNAKSGLMVVGTSEGPSIRGNTVSWIYKSKVTWGDRVLANQNATTTNRNSVTVSLFDDDDKAQEMLVNGKTRETVNNELASSSGLANGLLRYVPSVGSAGNSSIKNNMNTYGTIELVGETSVQAGLNKFVRGDPSEGFNASGKAEYSTNGTYEYRLEYRADASGNGNYVENVILFDRIEKVETPNSQGYQQGWRGKVVGIDLSHAKSLGIDAKAYVSTSPSMSFFKPNSGDDFSNHPLDWKDHTTVSAAQLKQTQSIGIDLRKKVNGQPYQFTGNDLVYVTIKMEMPDNFPTLPKAYNVPYLSATKVTSGIPDDALTEGTYTDFELFRNPDLTIVKQDLANPSNKLNGVTFEIEYPDGTKKNYTTAGQGEIKVTDLEPGKYTLREKYTKLGYELLTETYEFTVNPDRTITYPKDTTYWKYDFKNNTITLTVNNRKKFTLPITGGTGAAISLLAIAAFAVIVVIGWYLKKYRFAD